MMKIIPRIWLLCLLLTLAGCLTEVDPRDVDFEPVLVVQSFPQAGHPVEVKLTRTTPLWDPSRYYVVNTSPTDSFYVWDRTPDYVAGATVRLRVNDEVDYLLNEDSTGFYSLPLSAYQPTPQDRLHLTITTDEQSVEAETVLPKPVHEYTFLMAFQPVVVDSATTRTGPDTRELVYYYRQPVAITARFSDPANQPDFYLFNLEQIYTRPLPGSDFYARCGGSPLNRNEPRYALLRDTQQEGGSFTIERGWRVDAQFPASRFPDAEDRVATCALHLSVVQYGPDYDRFLQIDYQPASSETGSNIQGGLGLFTGIAVRDTTLVFELGAANEQ